MVSVFGSVMMSAAIIMVAAFGLVMMSEKSLTIGRAIEAILLIQSSAFVLIENYAISGGCNNSFPFLSIEFCRSMQ